MEVRSHCGSKPNPAILALKNPLILGNIFKFLSIEDYKPCRAVCWLWKDLREDEFKKKVRLCMNFYPKWMDAPDPFAKYPAPSDLSEFFRSCQMDHPFEALKLSGNVLWPASKLTELFATEGNYLKDVTFQNVGLKSNRKHAERLNCLIKNYPLMNMINGLVNLKSIHITCNGYTTFSLFLKDLVRFEDIHIHNCTIEMTKNSILTPRKLTLEDIIFTRNNVFIDLVVVNDFVNFSEMKALRLKSNSTRLIEKITTTAINLTSNFKLETVTLLNRNMDSWFTINEYPDLIFNLGDSQWEIDTLSMYGIPFIQENEMKMKRFHIYNALLCPDYLPSSLERLSISKLKKPFAYTNEIFMPNVKCLGLYHEITIAYILPFLAPAFPNLTELTLGSQEDNNCFEIDVSNIPQSVNKVMIIQPSFEFVGKKYIDTLVVRNASSDFSERIFRNLVPKSHFILFVDQLKDDDGQILLQALSKQSFQKLVFGMFDLKSIDGLKEHENFPNFDFPSYVSSNKEFFSLINENDNIVKCKSYKEMQKLLSNDQK